MIRNTWNLLVAVLNASKASYPTSTTLNTPVINQWTMSFSEAYKANPEYHAPFVSTKLSPPFSPFYYLIVFV